MSYAANQISFLINLIATSNKSLCPKVYLFNFDKIIITVDNIQHLLALRRSRQVLISTPRH